MSTFYLLNTTFVGTQKYASGALLDDAVGPKTTIEAAGGVFWPSADADVAAAALLVQAGRTYRGWSDEACDAKMSAAVDKSETALLSDATPAAVGTAAAGTSTDASRADHVHAHGNQLGGALHANAVGAGAAGFMTGADKTLLDAAVPSARTVTAGAGLTGGGDLSANRTITVAANADGSIIANADDIQVGILATDAQHGVRGGGTQHSAATTSVAGFQSAADKKFEDGLHSAAGASLADAASETIQITAGTWRKLPTLSQGGTLTLGTTGAVAGDQIEITRSSTSAFTYAIVNGGTGAGTLYTMAISVIGCAKFQFDGTDWALRSFGIQV